MAQKKPDLAGLASRWTGQLDLAKQADKDWIERGSKIVKRFRDDRDGIAAGERRFNILWSNIRTLLPAVYSRKPRAEVSRRYKDSDPVARVASTILERAIQFEIDEYSDFDSALKNVTLDRLLPGRGVAWVRFEPAESSAPAAAPGQDEEGAEPIAEEANEPQISDDVDNDLEFETSPTDYVFWQDFRHSPARTWEEVTWVARRVYMAREEGVKRFGKDFNSVPLSHEPMGLDQMKKDGASQSMLDAQKKAKVWEIWDKADKTVCWVAEGCGMALDCRPDPFGLVEFFPCPKPLYATTSTDSLVPVPDYIQYQDQAREIDQLTQRIALLVKAVKVVGVYDSSQSGVQRMLMEGVDNTLIPVDNWAAFGEKQGLKGTVDFLPLDMVINALQALYVARDALKQIIYEVTGLSDIIRGTSVASETATAQGIKSQFASLRLKETQGEIARFASDLLRIKAQMMTNLYRPQTLVAMSGIEGTPDAQMIPQAMQLLASRVTRTFRIQVAADSMIELDEQGEKQDRLEFLTAAGGFLKEAVPLAQQGPEAAKLAGELLMFGVRSFKAGAQIESAFDALMQSVENPQQQQQEPPPDPAMLKVQGDQQIAQSRMQLDQQAMALTQAKQQQDAQLAQAKLAQDGETERMKAEFAAQVEQMRQDAADAASQRSEQFERWKAQLEADARIVVASISAQAAVQPTVGPLMQEQ